jgi:hypothetical protein
MTACLTVIHALARLTPPSRKRPRGARPTPPCRPWMASVGPVRGSPVSETTPPLSCWAALKAERPTVAAKSRAAETEAASRRSQSTSSSSARGRGLAQCHRRLARSRTAALSPGLRRIDRVLGLLLHAHRLQPARDSRRFAQVRQVLIGYPARH